MTEYPKCGPGRRNVDCELYEACLDIASAEKWSDFNCEGCPKLDEGQVEEPPPIKEEKPARLCEICKEKPTIQPSSPYCASCMAKRARKRITPPKQPTEKDSGQTLTIAFGRYGGILEQVEKLANEEMRPLELQIIYMLRQCIEEGLHHEA